MQHVFGIILGGGRGSRLWPLTRPRAKPAVPIGGKYRLVDVPISNCLNSGIQQVAILTQFNSLSLHRHINRTYHFDVFHPGWVQILATAQTVDDESWSQGSADAVRKQLREINLSGAKEVLILAGDHLYRMDYARLVEHHRASGADITVATTPVSREEVGRFGILKQGPDGRLVDYAEKPSDERRLAELESRPGDEKPFRASMGIYVIRVDRLEEILGDGGVDFGQDVLPPAVTQGRFAVFGYQFTGYWRDIGTIRSFYEANLALTEQDPPYRFHDPAHPVFTRPRFLPGCRLHGVRMDRVLLSDGCKIIESRISNSVVGLRSVIGPDVLLESSVLMGADFYESERPAAEGLPALGLGRGVRIRGAILDKDVRVGSGVHIEPYAPGTNFDAEGWAVRDGLVVVAKGTVLAPGTRIGP